MTKSISIALLASETSEVLSGKYGHTQRTDFKYVPKTTWALNVLRTLFVDTTDCWDHQ